MPPTCSQHDKNTCKPRKVTSESCACHFKVKLLLPSMVHVYTRKCAAYIVEKYERSLVVG